MEKPVDKWAFDELATWVTQHMFNALIMGGTREMKSSFYIVANVYDTWYKANVLKTKKNGY